MIFVYKSFIFNILGRNEFYFNGYIINGFKESFITKQKLKDIFEFSHN